MYTRTAKRNQAEQKGLQRSFLKGQKMKEKTHFNYSSDLPDYIKHSAWDISSRKHRLGSGSDMDSSRKLTPKNLSPKNVTPRKLSPRNSLKIEEFPRRSVYHIINTAVTTAVHDVQNLRKSGQQQKHKICPSTSHALRNFPKETMNKLTPKVITTGMGEYFAYMKTEEKKMAQIKKFDQMTSSRDDLLEIGSFKSRSRRGCVGLNDEHDRETYQSMTSSKFRDTDTYISRLNKVTTSEKLPDKGKTVMDFFK